ncbi:MAG: putative toxin-antitoxin system toxin component, PIN family [Gammaproteobacteria bacterium]|nr:putative toxin-antitoxin system toxin component, PIN family [Gammaproteobacteria bacterium]
MTSTVCIVDTNVVVSGLITPDSTTPPTMILDSMLAGRLLYLMSVELLTEYSSVLRRPRIARTHSLADEQLDRLLTELVANAMWREIPGTVRAPDRGDDHLWALLTGYPQALLVTGDRLLLNNPPVECPVISPRTFVNSFLNIE